MPIGMTPRTPNNASHGARTWTLLIEIILPPTGAEGVVRAGPPGSVIVPLEGAVNVNVMMVLVESSVADGNWLHTPF